MTVSPTKGRAVGVLAAPEAPSEHMAKTPTEITAGSELRDEISKSQLPGIGGLALQSPRRGRAQGERRRPADKLDLRTRLLLPSPCSKPGSHAAGLSPDRPHPAVSSQELNFVFGIKPGKPRSSH
jgi:hypothetical protein